MVAPPQSTMGRALKLSLDTRQIGIRPYGCPLINCCVWTGSLELGASVLTSQSLPLERVGCRCTMITGMSATCRLVLFLDIAHHRTGLKSNIISR